MLPDTRWIEAIFRSPQIKREPPTHVAVPRTARVALRQMADELLVTTGLIAQYVPEGADPVYQVGASRGRIICVVQLLPMSSDRKIEDYFHNDWDGTRRWPIGWPCRLVYDPPTDLCPLLRDDVETLYGRGNFAAFTSQFQHGPFRLKKDMQDRLNREFAEFHRLDIADPAAPVVTVELPS